MRRWHDVEMKEITIAAVLSTKGKGGRTMVRRPDWWRVGTVFMMILCIALASGTASSARGEEAMFTVLNPLGKPPAITLVPLAPRPGTLDGKTLYFIDSGFPTTDVFMRELAATFAKTMPNVKTEFREKLGSFFDDDPKLWAEVKEKGGVVVLGVGH